MEKNLKNNENFYLNSLFTFESNKCFCAIDTTNVSPTEERKTFKVIGKENENIRFAFEPGKGLARINQKTGSIEEEDILSSLVSINDTNILGYKSFFERNGFFFKIRNDEFEKIDDSTLLYIITQMKVTTELLSQLSEVQRKDYNKILTHTLYLLYSAPRKLHVGEHEYFTCYHKKFNDALTHGADINNLSRTKIIDNLYYQVKDMSYGTDKVHIDVYREITSDPNNNYDDVYRKIMHSYVNDVDCDEELRTIIEFLYHVNYDIGQVWSVSPEEIVFNKKHPNWDKFTMQLKSLTIKVAKIVIGEEINHNIKGVHPEYDVSIMEPRWKVDSLLDAMYFSLFYMKPETEVTRLCKNPKCGRYFIASRTSLKKKYCCPECANRANQNNYRNRKK